MTNGRIGEPLTLGRPTGLQVYRTDNTAMAGVETARVDQAGSESRILGDGAVETTVGLDMGRSLGPTEPERILLQRHLDIRAVHNFPQRVGECLAPGHVLAACVLSLAAHQAHDVQPLGDDLLVGHGLFLQQRYHEGLHQGTELPHDVVGQPHGLLRERGERPLKGREHPRPRLPPHRSFCV